MVKVDAAKKDVKEESQTAAVPKLVSRFKEYLERQGYKVTEMAGLVGKSGVQHTFDMLAEKDDSLQHHAVAICLAAGGNAETEASAIFSFANKAFDTGISNRILVAVPEFSERSRQLAAKQRIRVLDDKQLEALRAAKRERPAIHDGPIKFETRDELVAALQDRGYRVEEKARVKGRSGIEYSFDMVATTNDDVSRTLAIDFLSDVREVRLEQVVVFDTKAYDAGITDKIIVVSPGLGHEAKQFAEHQKIRVLEQSRKPAAPAKAEGPKGAAADAKFQPKLLRQMPQPEALQLIPEVTARRYNAIPLTVSGNTLRAAMADPTDILALEALSAISKLRVEPVAASEKEVREAIDFNYKGYGEIERQISHIDIPEDVSDEGLAISATLDTPLTQAVHMIVDEAVKARASDIHIEPEEDRVRVRYRIDGILQDMMSLPLSIRRSLLSRLKILSDLNIADHQRPQDGQFTIAAKGRDIDVRVATAPTVWGEMAVLRLLDKTMAVMDLSQLGFMEDTQAKYADMLRVTYGMILISGPTGAGKTTTLYASVNSLDNMGRNIVTIEDPAEYRFKDINQIQVNPQAGITFASGLRSILRLDPDVILVGEIRDAETANIAVQAALTGHLVLSSIHASDTVGVLFRLTDLKVEPFLIASSVIGVVSQRMVRRICPDCSQPIEVPLTEQMAYEKEMGEKQSRFLHGTGCKSCAYTGYMGRVGLFEVMAMSDTIRTMVAGKADSSQIRAQAVKERMVPIMKDGMRKVKAGVTTPSEVLRSAYTLG
ncbi:MAG: secretion system protein [Dehalococcoidia bacterium]|nr:secretion system protein [Dehalococcoidia bacterium]